MIRILVSAFLLAVSTFNAQAVIGGDPSPKYMQHAVMVLSKMGSICSGVVISQNSILTAAHCIQDRSEFAVHYRTPSGVAVLLSPRKIISHPNYVPDAIAKRVRSIDLAIVQLEDPLPSEFQPVKLSYERPRAGDLVFIGGYGLTNEKIRSSNGRFLSSQLTVIEPYGPSKIVLWLRGRPIPKSNLNSGGCHGDSGGPIFIDDTLVAITTWTTGPAGYDCGNLTQGILIAPQIDWISKTIH